MYLLITNVYFSSPYIRCPVQIQQLEATQDGRRYVACELEL